VFSIKYWKIHERKEKPLMMRKALPHLLAALLLCLTTVGCVRAQNKNLPFYEFGKMEDGSGDMLTVEGVRYREDLDMVGKLGNAGKWIFTHNLGDPIGVCGDEEADRREYTIYEVKGDENRSFLFMHPSHFVIGPYRQYLGIREGVSLDMPASEVVSRIVVTCRDKDSKLVELSEFEDEAWINALLNIYYAEDTDIAPSSLPSGGTPQQYGLNLYHSEYPFLYFYITCLVDEEIGAVYLDCADDQYRRLLPGLEERIGVSTPEREK